MARLIKLGFPLVCMAWSIIACSKYLAPVKQQYIQYQVGDSVSADSAYIRYYLPYKQQLEAEMDRVIGHLDVNLTKGDNAPETLLGNFFADALLAEGRKSYPDAEFSFGTKGGLRIELQRGDITIGHLFELMPFENELVLLELSGQNVQQLAQFIASTGGQPISGIRMKIKDNQPVDVQIAGKPIDTSRTYKLLTYDYLANGGDNSRGLENPVNRINLGKKVRETLIDYVSQQTREGKHINTQLDGRITRN
ncbi:5'-nucleotidase C-terminal domain-containing protein [Parapedobacter koreensis]|uniref:5'-nucleotidase, C-terminal domain n=1 Tax=Parapedobacter koreensis TaxID=332977 RepID=A0A1H7LAH3_9SPHI|nr:5'-nucleotidase [Parapedobacter koreensis]SEK96013.1 5'-nucleotidase, C-terminal domain [Parapedobacter koreensis]